MRRAFSITASAEADVLPIDEVLAVGEFVCGSHRTVADQLCDAAIWRERGKREDSG
jgi:hypothetical protein